LSRKLFFSGKRIEEYAQEHEIAALADIHRFPSSRKFPQFNQDELSPALQTSPQAEQAAWGVAASATSLMDEIDLSENGRIS